MLRLDVLVPKATSELKPEREQPAEVATQTAESAEVAETQTTEEVVTESEVQEAMQDLAERCKVLLKAKQEEWQEEKRGLLAQLESRPQQHVEQAAEGGKFDVCAEGRGQADEEASASSSPHAPCGDGLAREEPGVHVEFLPPAAMSSLRMKRYKFVRKVRMQDCQAVWS